MSSCSLREQSRAAWSPSARSPPSGRSATDRDRQRKPDDHRRNRHDDNAADSVTDGAGQPDHESASSQGLLRPTPPRDPCLFPGIGGRNWLAYRPVSARTRRVHIGHLPTGLIAVANRKVMPHGNALLPVSPHSCDIAGQVSAHRRDAGIQVDIAEDLVVDLGFRLRVVGAGAQTQRGRLVTDRRTQRLRERTTSPRGKLLVVVDSDQQRSLHCSPPPSAEHRCCPALLRRSPRAASAYRFPRCIRLSGRASSSPSVWSTALRCARSGPHPPEEKPEDINTILTKFLREVLIQTTSACRVGITPPRNTFRRAARSTRPHRRAGRAAPQTTPRAHRTRTDLRQRLDPRAAA